MTGSYAPDRTVPGGLLAEVERLHAQAALTWQQEWTLLEPLFGVGPLVDLGCGAGAILRRLAVSAPDLPVIGVEPDPRLVPLARKECGPAQAVVQGLGGRLPLSDGSAGGLLARYVLQHVSDQDALLRDVLRVLRPGGWVAVVDVDEMLWGVAEPAAPEVADVYAKAGRLQGSGGGDRLVIRRMTRLLRASGFSEVQIRPFAVDSGTAAVGDLAVHLAPNRLVPALAAGVISLADYQRAVLAHARFESAPDAYVMLLGFVVLGRRPLRSA